jgi:hypothetical protein
MTSTMRFDKWENSLGSLYNSVLQVKRGYQNSFVTANSVGYTATGLKVQITPKMLNSIFYVSASGALNARPASFGAGICIYSRNLTAGGAMAQWSLDAGNLINGGYMFSNAASDLWGQAYAQGFKSGPTYNLGETLEFEVYVAAIGPGSDNSTTVRWGHDGFQNDIVVMEIAQ